MKLMKKIGSYLVLGLLFLTSACTQEPLIDPGNPIPDGKARVGLFTDLNNYQQPTSRAAADESSASGTGRMPWVFIFKGTGTSATFYEVKQAVLDGTNTYVMLALQSSAVEILLLANAPAYFHDGSTDVPLNETNLTTTLTGKTLAQTMALMRTVDASSTNILYDGGYLPMVGRTQLAKIESSVSIGTPSTKLSLKRIVAKVTVRETADNFTITNWSLINANKHTYFFDEAIFPAVFMNYTENLSVGGEANPVYTYPAAADEMAMIVKGVYNGTTCYYKLGFRLFNSDPNDSGISVERNTWHKVVINGVFGMGYSSFADAVAGVESNNIKATLSVTDLTSFDIIDNGQYYLGASNTQLLFYGVPTGGNLPYVAATIQTNATAAMAGGVNSITITGVTSAGSITLATSTLTLSTDGTTPGKTDIIISAIDAATFISANIVVKVGGLQQTIEVRKVSDAFAFIGGAMLLNYQPDVYTTAELTDSWFSLSADGINNVGTSYTQPNAASLTPIYLHAPLNFLTGAVAQKGELFLSRQTQGRVKAFLSQNALTPTAPVTPPAGNGIYPYVGAFWRANEVGERVIKIKVGAELENLGAWSAFVMWQSDQWADDDILLAPGGSLDPQIYKSTPGNAESYPVSLGEAAPVMSGVVTAGDSIMFRIGLNSRWDHHPNYNPMPAWGHDARYAIVMIAYNNNTKFLRLYLRQGEHPDYVYEPGEDRSTLARARLAGFRISPYNLTIPKMIDSDDYRDLALYGGEFTEYPTQSGAFFQWESSVPRRAWNASRIAVSGWVPAVVRVTPGFYFDAAVHETCPGLSRYYRVDHSDATPSLMLDGWNAPDLVSNYSVWGYYADGFFDRRPIENALGSNGALNSTVDRNSHTIAHVGRLLYNAIPGSGHEGASIFFPASGYRADATNLHSSGMFGYSWLSDSDITGYNGRYFSFSAEGVRPNGDGWGYAWPIRCLYAY